jgi:hypothetical protein
MASSDKNQDISRVLSELTKEIRKLTEARKGDGNIDLKTIKELNSQLEDAEDNLDKMNKGVRDSGKSFKELQDAHNDAIKATLRNVKDGSLAQKIQDKVIASTLKNHTWLGQAMADTIKSTKDLEKHLDQTADYLHKYSDAVHEASSASLSSIKDQATLKKVLDQLSKQMQMSAEVQELITKGQYEAAAKAIDQEALNAKAIQDSAKRTSGSFLSLAGATSNLKSGMAKALDYFGHSWVLEVGDLAGSVGLIMDGLKETYKDFWNTAGKGFGGAFLKLSGSAISLGVSLETLSDLAKENMPEIGKMGMDGFIQSLKDSQGALMRLGLTTEEAAKASALMTQNAFLSGVDIKDKKAINASQATQIKQYADLRSMTGESITALAEQTKSILTSNDTLKILQGLDKQQRAQVVQDINAERQRLTTMGLTNDAALDVVKTLQSMSTEKISDRLEQGNNVLAAGNMAGIDGGLSSQVRNIMMKSEAQQTADDKMVLAQWAKQYAQATNGNLRGKNATINSQFQADTADSYLSPQMLELVQNMGQGNLGRGLTPDQKKANAVLGQVNGGVADVSATIEKAAKLLESPLTKIAAGVAGILAFLVLRKVSPGNILGKLTGKGGGLGDIAENVLGRGTRGAVGEAENIGGGFSKMSKTADAMKAAAAARKADALKYGTKAGREAFNSTSIGSQALKNKLIPKGVPNLLGGAAEGAEGLLGLGRFVPIAGAIITGITAIAGAFHGASQAAEIFGKEENKDALTTAEKVSSGIAGALHVLSFGLIPTDTTARLFNDVAQEGAGVLTDYIEDGVEWVFNKAIPGVYNALKSVVGWIGGAILDALNPMVWYDAFVGKGSSGTGGQGVVGTLLQYMREAVEFMAVALAKGVTKIGTDILGIVTKHLPDWMVPDALKKASTWASTDTNFSDFDTAQEKKDRARRQALRAKRNQAAGDTDSDGSAVQGSATDGDNLGLVSGFGQQLSQDQLAAQGYGATGSPSSSSSDSSVSSSTPSSPTVTGAPAPMKASGFSDVQAWIKDHPDHAVGPDPADLPGGTTVVGAKKSEGLLEEIRDALTSLVTISTKHLDVAAENQKIGSTAARIARQGNQDSSTPTLADFMNMPI